MAYRRRSSIIIKKVQIRASNLEAISPTLDLGNHLTLAALRTQLGVTQNLLDIYNIKLAEADAALNNLQAQEKALQALSVRLLAAVGAVYGKDSNEYEQAGGKRRRSRRAKPA